jgi:hypothetical protein
VPHFELEEKPAEGEEDKEEEKDDEPEVIKYKFEVRCLLGKTKENKAAKKAEKK